MRRRKNLTPLLILTILSFIFLGWFSFKFPPEEKIRIMNYELGIMNFFFPLIFLASFSLFTLLLNNTRRGFLISLGVTVFLILRFLKLIHPFYLLILMATLIALELTFRKS